MHIRRRHRITTTKTTSEIYIHAPAEAFLESGAVISECGKYRYLLTRYWDHVKPVLTFLMLNPSTADAYKSDQTVRKCVGFAKVLGFGGIQIINLWAYRTKSPAELRKAGYPVGPNNDHWIEIALGDTDTVVCAWGEHARNEIGFKRIEQVRRLLKLHEVPFVRALNINTSGSPSHPLMLPYTAKLIHYSL